MGFDKTLFKGTMDFMDLEKTYAQIFFFPHKTSFKNLGNLEAFFENKFQFENHFTFENMYV